MSLKPQLLRYWLAMNASAADAAIHSSVAYFGVAGAHAALASVPALDLRQCAAVFLISFARAVLDYLAAHPLSALVPDSAASPTGDPLIPSVPPHPPETRETAPASTPAALLQSSLVPAHAQSATANHQS